MEVSYVRYANSMARGESMSTQEYTQGEARDKGTT
jgi:hypothetical protein